jgi:hypothetical protein
LVVTCAHPSLCAITSKSTNHMGNRGVGSEVKILNAGKVLGWNAEHQLGTQVWRIGCRVNSGGSRGIWGSTG